MVFIDDDTWPPSLHGIGGEGYFGHAWGRQHNAIPMCGMIVHDGDVPGFQHSYRFHLSDPVCFSKRLKVTMEHGHSSHLSDDCFSTAYWYQKLPTTPFGILPVEERLPLRPLDQGAPVRPDPRTDLGRRARADANERYERFTEARRSFFAQRAADAVGASRGNQLPAAAIPVRYLGS